MMKSYIYIYFILILNYKKKAMEIERKMVN